MRTVYDENEELRIAMGHYTRDRLKYNDMEQVNEQLQKALNFTEEQKNRYNYGSRIAQVISANSDPNSRTINIDIGENAGIKPGMAVTSQEGLVGVISHVSSYTSTVNLLTSMDANDPTSNAIAATAVGKEKVFGMIESYDPKTGMLKMTKISEDSNIKEDDEIISSGIINNFPKYMRIGKVKSVEKSEYGLTKTATIEPYASFLDWKELIVIIPPEVKNNGNAQASSVPVTIRFVHCGRHNFTAAHPFWLADAYFCQSGLYRNFVYRCISSSSHGTSTRYIFWTIA